PAAPPVAADPPLPPRGSAVAELRAAFLDERRHALAPVLGREQGMEDPALESQALGERRLVGAVDRLLDGEGGEAALAGDLRSHGDRLIDQLALRHDAADQTGAL